MRDIFDAYIAGDPDILPLFPAAHSTLWTRAPAATAWDTELVGQIRDYQAALGHRARLRGDEAAIVTGQQAGLLTGPLYTIYKAATAILAAQALEAKFDVPCVPVFWLHGDDHDFHEARSATIVTKRHDLLTLRYHPSADVSGLPMDRVPLEPSLHRLIDEAAHNVNGSELRGPVAAFLHESLEHASSFADWTARILARLFAGTPLIVFSPALPAARRIAAGVIARELEQPDETARLAQARADTLEQHDFAAQVSKRPEECSFFVLSEGKRRKVEYRNGKFVLPEENRTLAAGDMAEALARRPESFSPNVLLRGVVQQRLFPAAAYVAGPGEVAYWAQLQPVFARHGLAMPIVYPRARVALTTPKLRTLTQDLRLTLDDLMGNPDDLLNRTLRQVAQSPEMAYIKERRAHLESRADTFADELGALSPVGGSMAQGMAKAISRKLDHIERVVARRDRERRDTVTKQLHRLRDSLAPGGKPQERVLNVFSFLFNYGWELVPRLLQDIDVQSMDIQEIEL
jgi:bacillithiol synthase